jgi:hypothetical protein
LEKYDQLKDQSCILFESATNNHTPIIKEFIEVQKVKIVEETISVRSPVSPIPEEGRTPPQPSQFFEEDEDSETDEEDSKEENYQPSDSSDTEELVSGMQNKLRVSTNDNFLGESDPQPLSPPQSPRSNQGKEDNDGMDGNNIISEEKGKRQVKKTPFICSNNFKGCVSIKSDEV